MSLIQNRMSVRIGGVFKNSSYLIPPLDLKVNLRILSSLNSSKMAFNKDIWGLCQVYIKNKSFLPCWTISCPSAGFGLMYRFAFCTLPCSSRSERVNSGFCYRLTCSPVIPASPPFVFSCCRMEQQQRSLCSFGKCCWAGSPLPWALWTQAGL